MSVAAKGTGQVATPILPPGTFTSILPEVEDILGVFYGLAEGDPSANTEDIVAKVKVVREKLNVMRAAASKLPGGHLGTDTVIELTRILEEQASKKNAILTALRETATPIADVDHAVETGAGAEYSDHMVSLPTAQ